MMISDPNKLLLCVESDSADISGIWLGVPKTIEFGRGKRDLVDLIMRART